MSAGTAMGIDLALVSTGGGNAQMPLGFIHTVPAGVDGEGEKTYIYVSTVASINTALGLARAGTTYGGVTLSGLTEDSRLVGITINDMTDATLGVAAGTRRFGFVQRTGIATVTGAGAVGDVATCVAGGSLDVLNAIAGAPPAMDVDQQGVGTYLDAGTTVNLWCRG